MPKPATSKPVTPTPSAESARASFVLVQPALEALTDDKLLALPTAASDLKHAMTAAAQVAEFVAHEENRARFAKLPADVLDPAAVETFVQSVGALFHSRNELDAATASQSEVTLTETLAVRANDLRHRMLRVATHYFEDDSAMAADLKPVGRKKGHRALVSDLQKLAALYDAQKSVIERDPKHYRETDPADARAVAEEVSAALEAARGEAEKTWSLHLAQAFTLVLHTYEDVQAAGVFLFRRESGAENFPVLYAARRARSPNKKKEDGGEVAAMEPVAPAEAVAPKAEEARGDA